MAAAAGIFSHAITAGQALTGKALTPMDSSTPVTSSTSSSSDSSSDSATISANDFLTLLVTEMQNQDPTADTDPNEYIDQLVQVNSLEQLININQTLTTDLGSSSTSSGSRSDHAGYSSDVRSNGHESDRRGGNQRNRSIANGDAQGGSAVTGSIRNHDRQRATAQSRATDARPAISACRHQCRGAPRSACALDGRKRGRSRQSLRRPMSFDHPPALLVSATALRIERRWIMASFSIPLTGLISIRRP